MKVRSKKPKNNKYYIRQASGGYNGAVQGKPTDRYANVLSNCVGYANGRFNEIIGEKKCKFQLVCNAENFIERAKALGLKVSKVPVVGGIMVWRKGKTLSGKDGAGHVAIVEKVIDDNTIYTSESAWLGTAFFNATRKNNNGRWGMAAAYTFRGCIVNPATKSASTDKASTSTNTSTSTNGAGTYKLLKNMNVRTRPNLNGTILRVLPAGTKIKADKVKDNWLHSTYYNGWICIKDAKERYCEKL